MTDIIDRLKELASRPEAKDALIGAGIGAGGGALTGAMMDGDFSHALRNALIGAGIGGTAGYLGGGAVRSRMDKLRARRPDLNLPEPPPAAPAPKHMNLGTAAASGMAPFGIGSAIHGQMTDGPGNAAAQGGGVLAGQLAGSYAGMKMLPPKPGQMLSRGAAGGGMAGGVIAALLGAALYNRNQTQPA